MPLLDAALAYAITMLAVATVVTIFTNALQQLPNWLGGFCKNLLGERTAIFKKMIDKFVKVELTKIVGNALHVDPNVAKSLCDAAVEEIKESSVNEKPLAHLSNSDLLAKFESTQLGQELLKNLGTNFSQLIDQISARYTAIEKEYTELFRTKSRVIATFVSFVLAIVLNIDSINILGSYIRNPALRAAVGAQSEKVMADYKVAVANIEKIKAEPPAANVQESIDKLNAQAKQIDANIAGLNSDGFPIGWSYFPYWPYPPSVLNPWDPQYVAAPSWNDRIKWLAGIALTGLLAGLGAPFWYDLIRTIVQLTRGGSSSSTSKPDDPQSVADLKKSVAELKQSVDDMKQLASNGSSPRPK